ncbi:MAG: FAD-dependent oxidoreductase [Oligoflexales bacterium]|nr:FAD-dependent oxidoreductase [Oligoflexales bacterium]
MQKRNSKLVLFILLFFFIAAFFYFDLGRYLSLEYLKSQQEQLNQLYQNHSALVIGSYFVIYVISTALSFPGATVLTLLGGAIFGFGFGLVIVSVASTLGATLAFLMARFFLRDYVQAKFGDRLASLNRGIEREGDFYLFTLRLVPLVPFFVINLVMGLTPISTRRFFFVSQIGMVLGTAVYINAGTQLAQINSLKGIVSPEILLSFVLLGVFPLIAKKILDVLKTQRALRGFKRPKKYDYNVVVIGAGSAGLVSSYIAAAVKAKVALIEKHKMGGDCLNTGCVPSKALIKTAKILATQKKAKEYGLEKIEISYDFSAVMQRIQKVIKKIEPHDSVERYSNLGVECIQGSAHIRSPFEVEVNGRILTTKNIVIATGARPLIPKISGLESVPYKTSDDIWQITELPKRLLVLGGGPIGCELAQAFQRLGSQVTLLEMASQLLPREDGEVSAALTSQLLSEGVTILTDSRADRFETKNGKNSLVYIFAEQKKNIEFDLVLLAIGRKPNTEGFGLEALKIQLDSRGKVQSDAFMRTNYPNIFVCGDITGDYQFTHVSAHEAWYAVVNALFGPFKMFAADYRVIPMVTFTDPEIARVGLNEKEAKAKGVAYEVSKYGIDDLDRAIADSEDHGEVKVLTVPGKDKILGVSIVGVHAGDILAEFVLAMKYNLGLNKILGTIHAYPTLAESNKYVAGVWKKNHAPAAVLKMVERFHAWRRG